MKGHINRLSWVLGGALLLIILLNLATSYGMNLWRREIFDALEKRDSETVLLLSMLYFPLLAASVFHFGDLTIGAVKSSLRSSGVVVR